jgi:hypothetical protein
MENEIHGINQETRHKIPIFIDGQRFEAPEAEMTGEQIRNLPVPPIDQNRDLWLDRDGGLDELITDEQTVHLRSEMRFFTVPRVINPGLC